MDKMRFQALFDHSSIGIILSDRNGVIEKANLFATKIFGYAEDELNGQKIEVLIPAHLRERHIGHRMKYNENPMPRTMGSTLNLLAVKKNGEQLPVEISLSYFETDGHRQIVSFVNDITDRKKTEQELKRLTEALENKVAERTKELSDALAELNHTNEGLEKEMERRKKIEEQVRHTLEREKELNELKSRFVSMASHEFRTPLSGILTSISLIARYQSEQDAPKREKHIQTIKKSVRSLTGILNDFLSLDKLDQGKFAPNPTGFELVQFLETMAEEFRDISEKGQVIELVHGRPTIDVYHDREMLRIIFSNLLSNAIKYSPQGSSILIKSSINQGELGVSIKDHGIGIPVEDQKHLFERFFRAHNVTTVQGTGLGLNIVKRYLDLIGGRIEFTSQQNQGTTFTVNLPMGNP